MTDQAGPSDSKPSALFTPWFCLPSGGPQSFHRTRENALDQESWLFLPCCLPHLRFHAERQVREVGVIIWPYALPSQTHLGVKAHSLQCPKYLALSSQQCHKRTSPFGDDLENSSQIEIMGYLHFKKSRCPRTFLGHIFLATMDKKVIVAFSLWISRLRT